MTLVTLNDLLEDPTLDAYASLQAYGYREDTVNGKRHYVGRDKDMRAVIGPVRHRAKTLLGVGRKRSRGYDDLSHTLRMSMNREAADYAQKMSQSFETVDFSKLPDAPPPPLPQEKPMRRLGTWLRDKWYDDEWHKGSRNTAATTLMWSFTALSLLTFAKGALWLITL